MNRKTPRMLCAILVTTAIGVLPALAVEPTGSVPEIKGFKKNTLVKGLTNPWGLEFLPNGDMLVTERPGRMRIIRDGKLLEQPIKGVPEVFASGQGGLLDVKLHPNYKENQLIYFTYSSGSASANRTSLGRARLVDMELKDVQEIFRVSPDKSGGQHFGSVLQWLPDGTLLMSIGDGGNPPQRINGMLAREQAQNLGSHNGSVLRLTDEGKPAPDNPFVGKDGAKPEIFSYGHRNIQGITLDSANRIWTTEHGPRGGDELHYVEKGKNYGWPNVSFGRDYVTNELVAPKTTSPEYPDPVVVWVPSTAVSGLTYFTGDKIPAWKGSLLSGGLVSQDIRVIKMDGTKPVEERSARIGRRVREVEQGPDGYVYVLTDHGNGELIRLEPDTGN